MNVKLVTVTIVTSQDIEQVNAQRNLSLKENDTIARNKDINIQSAKPRSGTLQNKLWNQYLDGITTHGVDVTIVVSMGTLEKIA